MHAAKRQCSGESVGCESGFYYKNDAAAAAVAVAPCNIPPLLVLPPHPFIPLTTTAQHAQQPEFSTRLEGRISQILLAMSQNRPTYLKYPLSHNVSLKEKGPNRFILGWKQSNNKSV